MKLIIQYMLFKFASSKLGLWLAINVLPYARLSFFPPALKGSEFNQIVKLLKKGDLLFKREVSSVTGKLIGGTWQHVALYVGDQIDSETGLPYNIVEMTRFGLSKNFVFDLCKEADYVGVYRPNWTDEYFGQILERLFALFGEHPAYDFDFDVGNKKFYCSELIWYLDFKETLGLQLSKMEIYNTAYVSPDDVSKGKLTLIWTNHPEVLGERK